MELSQILNYYKSCFQADNRELVISNFLGSKVDMSTLIEGREDVVNGFLPYLPIGDEQAVELQKEIQFYSREKELMYCSFFILGKDESFRAGKAGKLFAPLMLYPAELYEHNNLTYIQPDLSKRRFNYSVLASLRTEDNDTSDFYDDLMSVTKSGSVTTDDIILLSSVLEKYISNLDTTSIVEFPELWAEKKIKRALQPRQLEKLNGFMLIPASGYGMVRKTGDAMGVISELTTMIENKKFSSPLNTLFGNTKIERTITGKRGRVPAVLNLAQQKIIDSAHNFPFMQITGPPGTGKTYTIAALAVEHISRGETVLIASRTDQAVDVVGEKIEEQLGMKNVIVRGGRSKYLSQLRKFLQNLLSGVSDLKSNFKGLPKLEKELNKLENKIAEIENEFESRSLKEIDWGSYLAELNHEQGWFDQIRKKYIDWASGRKIPLWDLIENLNNSLHLLNKNTLEYIEDKMMMQISHTLQHHRDSLNNFLKALKARTGTKQSEYFDATNIPAILNAFPIWLVRMGDIYRVLPLEEELFDIAIIDEATQCDIATCLPIMQRAKRVVIAGDPNQLRHVSFLSGARQNYLLEKNNLESHSIFDFRNNSILDIVGEKVQDNDQIVFLNEHYRSLLPIIEFSNQHFYNNLLNIMTSRPGREITGGVELIKCNGTRNTKGFNTEETEKIIEKVKEIIKQQSDLDPRFCESLGILSPLRDQVEYINKRISADFQIHEIKRHNLRAGTAYSFQGEERDRMFISFALDDESHPSAYYHINKPDVFNVSITRARTFQYIYYSFDKQKLKTDSLLRQYIDSFANRAEKKFDNQVKDSFAQEVLDKLQENNIKTWHAFPVAGLEIDLIAQNEKAIIGIDLIGFPGEFEDAFTLERYKMLNRAGLRTYPLPYTRWIFEQQTCITELLQKML